MDLSHLSPFEWSDAKTAHNRPFPQQDPHQNLAAPFVQVESPLFEVLTEHIHNDNTNVPCWIFAVLSANHMNVPQVVNPKSLPKPSLSAFLSKS